MRSLVERLRVPGIELWTTRAVEVGLPLLGALVMVALQMEWIRARTAIGLAGTGLLVAISSQWNHLRSTSLVLLAALVSIPVVLRVPTAIFDRETGIYELTVAGALSICGFLLCLPLWHVRDGAPSPVRVFPVPRWVVPVVVGCSVALAAAGQAHLSGGVGLVIDENAYSFQADYVFEQPRGLRLGEGFVPFLIQRCMFYRDGFLNGQYTPGWPAFLAVLRLFRADTFAGPLLFVCAIALVIAAGRRLASLAAAILAAALTVGNWTFLFFGVSYFSHTFAATVGLLAFYCLLRCPDTSAEGRARLETAAGGLIGLLILVRPLTGVSLGASLILWYYLRRRPDAIASRTIVYLGAGAVPPVAALLAYNFVCSGSPFRFGYDIANADLGGLGFGLRGMVTYTADGRAVARVAEFGIQDGLASWLAMLASSLADFWPSLAILPLVFASVVHGLGIRWARAAPFALLPLAHFFYYFRDSRLFVELIPFAMLGTACLADELSKRRATTLPVMAGVLALTIASSAYGYVARHRLVQSELAYFSQVERLRATFGRVLIFVREADAAYPDMSGLSVTQGVRAERRALERLFWYNTRGFPGDVVVARDLPDRRLEFAACLPSHQPVLLTARFDDAGFWTDPDVQILQPAVRGAQVEGCFGR